MCPQLRPDELERRLQERLDASGQLPAPLHVLTLPDFDRVGAIQSGSR